MLWVWRRLAAIALIPPLAWKLPYAMGAELKKKKKKACVLLVCRIYVEQKQGTDIGSCWRQGLGVSDMDEVIERCKLPGVSQISYEDVRHSMVS